MDLPTRPYFCAVCTETTVSTGFPVNWYVLTRSRGADLPKIKLGIYCSLECLEDNLDKLETMANAFDKHEARA